MKQSTAKMAASASNSGHAGESGLMEEANGGSGAAAAMDPLSTFLVRPFRHQMPNSPDSYIQVTEKGFVCLYLAKQQKKISISPDGLRVFIENTNAPGSKLEYRPFQAKPGSAAETSNEIGQATTAMPTKLRPWYVYAAKFVQTIRTKSPKIVIR